MCVHKQKRFNSGLGERDFTTGVRALTSAKKRKSAPRFGILRKQPPFSSVRLAAQPRGKGALTVRGASAEAQSQKLKAQGKAQVANRKAGRLGLGIQSERAVQLAGAWPRQVGRLSDSWGRLLRQREG